MRNQGSRRVEGGGERKTHLDQLLVSFGLLYGSEGVHIGEAGHSKGDHRGGAVELHGA
jgi:hypothetical protein